MRLDIHIDGGSRGNPGPAATAVVATDLDTGKLVHESAQFLGQATNNEAEYQALLQAIRLALDLHAHDVQFSSDSELMVRQITGAYRVKSPELRALFDQAQTLLLKLDSWRIKHVKREENRRADELVNQALDARRDVKANSAGSPPDDRSPAWVKIRLTGDPGGACPARCQDGQWFTVGPDTPQGLCVYATKAVLDAVLTDPNSGSTSTTPRATCPRCRVRIVIEPAD